MSPAPNKSVLIARGRLKEARKLFAHRDWPVLPRGRRGQRILAWTAIQAWLAYPANPEAGVRRVCGPLAPYLKEPHWLELIADTRAANRHFTADQCAMVLELSLTENRSLSLRFLGVDDDPMGERRLKERQAKNAARQRKYRGAHSTGNKPGRPHLELSQADIELRKAHDAARKREERAAKSTGRPRGRPKSTKNASVKIPSRHKIEETRSVTEFIRTHFQSCPVNPPGSVVARLKRASAPSQSIGGWK